MIETLAKASFFQSLDCDDSLLFEGLWDTPKALIIKALQGRPILVITSGDRETRLYDDLKTFGVDAIEFPAWETLPGEEIAPSPDIVGKRLEILANLKQNPVVLTPLQNLLQKVPAKQELFHIKAGLECEFESLIHKLKSFGYEQAKICGDKGEFAVRGGIVDVFPISSPHPFRIEFFGDEIDQIRLFDPMSQKSVDRIEEFSLLPTHETSCSTTLLEILGPETLILFDDLVAIEDKWVALKSMPGFEHENMVPIDFQTPHRKIFFTKDHLENLEICHQKLEAKLMRHPFLTLEQYFEISPPSLEALREDLGRCITRIADTAVDLYYYASSKKERQKLESLAHRIPKKTTYVDGYLSSGFVFHNTIVLPDTELTRRYKVSRKKWRSTYHTPVSEFHELSAGDLVVHFHNGIGKYLGIEKQKNHLGEVDEFMILEYSGKSKLYVPLSQSHLVSRYIGSSEAAPALHTIGAAKWQKAKQSAQQSIIGYAKDMLHLQAERESKGGFVYPEDSDDMLLFEEEFPYTETEDQLKAIADIKRDMCSNKAMDRLVCGDVGYGKTEVAMRAAFKAACDGNKQVAVLVPTTVLAVQHYESFKARMAHFPVNVGVVSRFQKPKEVRKTLEKLASGQIDILVGTHRLISKDVVFKDLGLIIIDEEQRFGVRTKEKLKKFKVGVDCITMSATPIPRTLYLSLISARDMSVINSPPQDRLPIKTIISERENQVIKNALMRELARDGQAYFCHNRVESIHGVANDLQKLVPTARIGVAHGQMDPDEIDTIFHGFKAGEIDLLVATSLIENGIDIPNANTILIDRAHHFGVADLYQLRGRVGRWNKAAYAYFLTPENRELPEVSQKRLQALVEASGYGGGMKLAMRDLELRGAGDILGVKQSGQVTTIGFHLYCKLLKKAVKAIQNKKPASFLETKMEFKYDAQIPDFYIDDTSLKLEIYHRLGEAETETEVDALLQEIEDRFGKAPPPVLWLYHLTRIRIFATGLHIASIKFEKMAFHIERKGKKKSFLMPAVQSGRELEMMVKMKLQDN
ncbi:MAG: transcription-repair coupling factor [Simkaniaceae bacterium]|nr:transcription-repair coupling factor [Simkaniaceae bacterium]